MSSTRGSPAPARSSRLAPGGDRLLPHDDEPEAASRRSRSRAFSSVDDEHRARLRRRPPVRRQRVKAVDDRHPRWKSCFPIRAWHASSRVARRGRLARPGLQRGVATNMMAISASTSRGCRHLGGADVADNDSTCARAHRSRAAVRASGSGIVFARPQDAVDGLDDTFKVEPHSRWLSYFGVVPYGGGRS